MGVRQGIHGKGSTRVDTSYPVIDRQYSHRLGSTPGGAVEKG